VVGPGKVDGHGSGTTRDAFRVIDRLTLIVKVYRSGRQGIEVPLGIRYGIHGMNRVIPSYHHHTEVALSLR